MMAVYLCKTSSSGCVVKSKWKVLSNQANREIGAGCTILIYKVKPVSRFKKLRLLAI